MAQERLVLALTAALAAGLASTVASQDLPGEVIGYLAVPDPVSVCDADFEEGTGFGIDTARIGDLDGDGIDEIAIGATRAAYEGEFTGAVWIAFMDGNGGVRRFTKINTQYGMDPSLLLDGAGFGSAVCGLGDIDGDDVPDIAVGASGTDGFLGAVWIITLTKDGHPKAYSRTTSMDPPFAGLILPFDNLGVSIASLGDLNGDGSIEIAIGADGFTPGPFGSSGGVVWIVSIRGLTIEKIVNKIVPEDAAATADTLFGQIVRTLGDFDGDGIADLIVGAPQDHEDGPLVGTARILLLSTGGEVRQAIKLGACTGLPCGVLSDFDLFGSGIAALGDLDNDGVLDVAIGAIGDDDTHLDPDPFHGQNETGAVYVIFLRSDGSVKSYAKISDLSGGMEGALNTLPLTCRFGRFGKRISNVGDTNSDGVDDLISWTTANTVLLLSMNAAVWTDLGMGFSEAGPIPRLSGLGSLVANEEATVGVRAAPAFALGVIAFSSDLGVVLGGPNPVRLPDDINLIPLIANAAGTASRSARWPAGIASDSTFYAQAWFVDRGAGGGLMASNGLSLKTP